MATFKIIPAGHGLYAIERIKPHQAWLARQTADSALVWSPLPQPGDQGAQLVYFRRDGAEALAWALNHPEL